MTLKNQFRNPETDEQSIEQANLEKLIELQSTILGTTVTSDNYEELLNQLCLYAEELTPDSVASIMLFDQQKAKLFVHAAPSIPVAAVQDLDGLSVGDGSCGNAVFHDEDMFVCDTLTDSRWDNVRSFAEQYKIHACWSSPIRNTKKGPVGSFALSSFEKRQPDNFQRLLLNSCASIAGIIIHREHLLNESREDQNKLIHSQQQYRSLVENSADAIFLHDAEGKFLDINQMACESLGYTQGELLSMGVLDVEKTISATDFNDFVRNLAVNETYTVDGLHQAKDGHQFPVEVRLRKFFSSDKELVVALARDVSLRKKQDEEELKERKLNSIGLLAGGIAHDFNNMLGGIHGYIELAEQNNQRPEKVERYLQKARSATLQAADLTQQLLTFSKGGEPIKQAANLFEIIEQSTDFILHGSNIKVEYICNCKENLWPVDVDSAQISQVMQNLVINARQAMPDGGGLIITCENYVVSDTDRLAHSQQTKFNKIIIKDNGCGIPEDIIESIFDPYFTTKQQGNGLGLALAYSIIHKHKGSINVDSSSEQGTSFTVLLPASNEEQLVSDSSSTIIIDHEENARIMLMDDDPMLREVSGEMLMNLGYEIIESIDGETAFSQYQDSMNTENSIDLIIMDLTIPSGIGGKEAIKMIQQIDPDVKALVSSGYSNDPVMANYAEYGFVGAIKKPYSQEDLADAVNTVLQAREGQKI